MEENISKASIRIRGIAFISDYFICLLISLIIFFNLEFIRKEILVFRLLGIHFGYLSSTPIIVFLLMLKDIIIGKSIGKRWVKIMVRDYYNPTKVPSLWRLILRNITVLIWPVEYIFMLINREHRRMGDIIAGTDVFQTIN